MAYTLVRTPSVFGNVAVEMIHCTADSAEANIVTRLGKIVGFSYGPSSMNSSNIHIAINSNSTGLAANGTVGISGCTSGDDFYLVVYGR
jgi:hypothetical protein